MRTEPGKLQGDLLVLSLMEENGQGEGYKLTKYGGDGGAGHAQAGESQKTKDQNGIQDDIDDGAGSLGDHVIEGLSGGLQQPFKGDLQEDTDAEDSDDLQILRAILNDPGIGSLGSKKRAGTERPEDGKDQTADKIQKQTVAGSSVHLLLIAFSQAPGKKGVHTNAESGRHRDHKSLYGKGQRNGGQRIFTELCHKHAVYNIIKGLYQHGQHHGKRYGNQKRRNFHRSHFILFWFHGCVCFHVIMLRRRFF